MSRWVLISNMGLYKSYKDNLNDTSVDIYKYLFIINLF